MIKYRDEKQREILQYGAKVMLSEISKMIIIIAIAFTMGYGVESLVVLLSIITLRRYIGGLHLKSYWSCFVYTAAVFILIIFIGQVINISRPFIIVICLLASIIVWKCAPIISSTRAKYSKKKLVMFKRRAEIILVLQTMICLVSNKKPATLITFTIIYQMTEILCIFFIRTLRRKSQ